MRRAGPADTPVLVLLPPAGGSAQSFAGWQHRLPPHLDLVAAQYPGRGSRRREPLPGTVAGMAAELAVTLCARTGPVHIFGHSLGALVGYELCWQLQNARRAPATFVASAAVPPHRRAVFGSRLTDALTGDLATLLAGAHTLSAAVEREPRLLRRREPIYRADFAAAHSYIYGTAQRLLRTPLVAVGGAQDPLVPVNELVRWPELAAGPSTVHTLPGGHFYYLDSMSGLMALIRRATR
ncbi:thioesterase II family protein [Actinoplanes sp. NPDC049599]|jgi:surfactin synthase thioesterase subunit|uniref:thioesterase II family protein n=1 Tax=Actinoplanes sp. NPDC049599 TaxID=3363903 RepID=UPI00378F7BE2